MKALLYKQLKLTAHPMTCIFPLLSLMIHWEMKAECAIRRQREL